MANYGIQKRGTGKAVKLQSGMPPSTTSELRAFSIKRKPSKTQTNLIKRFEETKVKFDPHLKIERTNPEKKSKTFIKIGKKGAGIYFEKKFSKGGMPSRKKSKGYFRSTESGAGMTQKGVEAYRRKNPGSKLKTAVTGKVKPGSKAAKRRKSYCARSLGQLKKASAKTRNDPNSRIRQARRRWKC
jgi:hypothetical protein